MFDDLNQQNKPENSGQIPVQNFAPKVAVDMFAETEPVMEKPAQFQPVNSGSNNAQFTENEPRTGNIQKIFFLVITLFGFSLLIVGGFLGYKYFITKKVIVQEDKQVENAVVAKQATTSEVVSESVIVDTDKDGLSDTEEAQFGTNSNSVDTDNDGLFDREEVKIYKTDPKNFDTDGDGISDGDEVKAKRNPNGSGDLFGSSSDSASTSTTTTTSTPPNVVSGSITSSPVETQTKQPESSVTDVKSVPVQEIVDPALDSDKDGLTDVDELNKYKTNPKNPDTDGDGYSDGAEVKGGYNPNGAGKLAL